MKLMINGSNFWCLIQDFEVFKAPTFIPERIIMFKTRNVVERCESQVGINDREAALFGNAIENGRVQYMNGAEGYPQGFINLAHHPDFTCNIVLPAAQAIIRIEKKIAR